MRCSICGSISTEVICNIRDFYCSGDNFELMQCNYCGVVFTNFVFDSEKYKKYYTNHYFAHVSKSQTWRYREEIQLNSLKMQKGSRLTLIERWCTKILRKFILVDLPYKKNGSILDIGCGVGNLLNVAKLAGFKCYGVEPSANARKILEKNGHIAYDKIQKLKRLENSFDIVIFNQSLEHMENPIICLKTVRQFLKPDGFLIISVPNYACNERKVFGEFWRHLDVPRHIFHFSPSILKNIVHKTGYEIINMRYKFWGFPGSTFKMAKKMCGVKVYRLLFLYFNFQVKSFLTGNKEGYGTMISLYLRGKKT